MCLSVCAYLFIGMNLQACVFDILCICESTYIYMSTWIVSYVFICVGPLVSLEH